MIPFHVIRDLRFAARTLAKAPGFTAVAVVCLALGIGANSTVFSLVDGYWTRPLPVRNPQELVHLFTATPRDTQASVSYAEFLDYQARAKSFSGLLATERRGGILVGDGFADAGQWPVHRRKLHFRHGQQQRSHADRIRPQQYRRRCAGNGKIPCVVNLY